MSGVRTAVALGCDAFSLLVREGDARDALNDAVLVRYTGLPTPASFDSTQGTEA